MILSFKDKWPDGTPNYFPALIIKCMIAEMVSSPYAKSQLDVYDEIYNRIQQYETAIGPLIAPTDNRLRKIHTIRTDPKKRWKAGNKIHPYVGRYTAKNRVQFAPEMQCISVQEVRMRRHNRRPLEVWVSNKFGAKRLTLGEVRSLALNDGFPGVMAFRRYFTPKPGDTFTGRIIHWTYKTY